MRLTLILLGFGLFVPLAAAAQPPPSESERAYYVLTRLGFGPAGNDVQRVTQMGVDNYIDQQLHPESVALPPGLQAQMNEFTTLTAAPIDLFLRDRQLAAQRKDAGEGESKKAIEQALNAPEREARDARLLKAIESPRQLQEALVDFWFNHFNVYAHKEIDRIFVGQYEQQAIRPYVFGHFHDMLEATAKNPAMLYYLDNWKNVAPSTKPLKPGQKPPEEGINENYAREVMELHTLGADGGYSQSDVTQLARILSGWGFGGQVGKKRPQFLADSKDMTDAQKNSVFVFNPDHHDFGEKIFLGRHFAGTGQQEGEQALALLAYSPVTAHHISYELAQYFVADNPPASLVDHMADVWANSNGDLRAVTEAMIKSPEFWDEKYRGDKYRTPLQYVASAVRAGGAAVDTEVIAGTLQKMGEEIYGCLTPDGYKNTVDAWLNTSATEERLTFATALGSGKLQTIRVERNANGVAVPMKGDDKPQPLDPARVEATLDNFFSSDTRAAVDSADPNLQAALLLGSPEMMRR